MNHVLRSSSIPLASQIALALGGVGWLTVHPPVEGAILMVPLSDAARAGLPQAAIDRGGQLLRTGGLPGSFVVHGRRDLLAGPEMLLIAADSTGCAQLSGAE